MARAPRIIASLAFVQLLFAFCFLSSSCRTDALRLLPQLYSVLHRSAASAAIAIAATCYCGLLPAHADDAILWGLKKDRLLACKPKSNCISTSSVNSINKYARPWTYDGDDASKEFDTIVAAIKSTDFIELAEDTNKEKLYIHATAKSALPPTGTDDIEFLILPQDKLITYRTNSREVVFAGTSQIGDAGSQKNRLAALQRKLGAKEMGDYASEMFDGSADFGYALPSVNFFRYQAMANNPDDINFVDNKPVDNADNEVAPLKEAKGAE